MWTAGHMKINIWNAYCGQLLVACPSPLALACPIDFGWQVASSWHVQCLCHETFGSYNTWVWAGTSLHGGSIGRFASAWLTTLTFRPDIKQDYPTNLSILISRGKENNCDFLSNGEGNGYRTLRNVTFGRVFHDSDHCQVGLWLVVQRGW